MSAIPQTNNVCRRPAKPKVWLLAVLILLTVALATPAQAQVQSDQRFTMITRGEGATGVAVGRGPITGVGTFRETEEDVGVFSFPAGTLTIRGFFTEESTDFDPRSCIGTFLTSGTWVVEDGTGAYEGASGGGSLEGRVKFGTERTAEGCGETETFAIAVFQLRGGVALRT